MNMSRVLAICAFVLVAQPAYGIVEAIDELREEMEGGGDVESAIDRAEAVIERGEETIRQLRTEVRQLETEKAELQRIQTALTSGLIGAIVTAIVAISGAVMKTMSSKADRDIKRLDVLEKMAALEGKGIVVPADIRRSYGAVAPGTGDRQD